MSYRQTGDRNWGILVACLIAVPLALAWAAIALVGGSLECADAAAQCDGVIKPLVEGIAAIALIAAALAWTVNFVIRVIIRAQ